MSVSGGDVSKYVILGLWRDITDSAVCRKYMNSSELDFHSFQSARSNINICYPENKRTVPRWKEVKQLVLNSV